MARTRVLSVDPDDPDDSAIEQAVSVLLGGGLVAFATETVYGLGAVATDVAAVDRIFRTKGRPAFNPLIVHVQDEHQARAYANAWTPAAQSLASRFWPGPLTLILPRTGSIPDITTGGRNTVALRVPSPIIARCLISRTGHPLAAPSANRSNRLSPTKASHVLDDLDGLVDLVLDSGHTSLGIESTVIDLSGESPRILRPGPIAIADIAQVIGPVQRALPLSEEQQDLKWIASPGQLPVHYAPQTPAFRVDSCRHLVHFAWPDRAGLLTFQGRIPEDLPPTILLYDLPDATSAGKRLYDSLHRMDAMQLAMIVVVMPPNGPEWTAVHDRLARATSPL